MNHASINQLSQIWGKSLNELNCNLHSLDSIASATKSALKTLEKEKGSLYGSDCLAENLVMQFIKFRYKDGKDEPKNFKNFLDDEGLPRGILCRY